MAEPTPSTFLQALRVLCASLMASLMIILVAVVAVLSQDGTGSAPIWGFGVIVAAAAGGAYLISLLGYRFAPIAPGTAEADARLGSVAQVQKLTVIRFALAEAVALVAIAIALVVKDGGVYLSIAGVALAEVLMFMHVWPSERMISKVQEALESAGGLSYLREALAAPPPSRKG